MSRPVRLGLIGLCQLSALAAVVLAFVGPILAAGLAAAVAFNVAMLVWAVHATPDGGPDE